MRFVRLEFLGLFAAFALLVAEIFLGGPHYLCHMTGRVTAACCCASHVATRVATCQPKLSSADCCELLTPGTGSQANRGANPREAVQPAALAAILETPGYALRRSVARRMSERQSRGPPLSTTPLFLAHCALLT